MPRHDDSTDVSLAESHWRSASSVSPSFGESSGTFWIESRQRLLRRAIPEPCAKPVDEATAWMAQWRDEPSSGRGAPLRLGGTYRFERLLGHGAMGQVALAFDESLQRQVAIKFPDSDRWQEPGASAQLWQEAWAMAQVRSSHVVEPLAFGGVEVPYLVMEYMPGGSLTTRLAQSTPLSLDESLDVLSRLCDGVEAIHAAGLVHCDLKPSNVLLGAEGRVAVADLGLAMWAEDMRKARELRVVGTPAYIAPEVFWKNEAPCPLVASRDIYALGVIAYRLLAGRLPFESPDISTLMAMHAFSRPEPLRSQCSWVPECVEEVVLSALAKEPAKRVTSAREMQQVFLHARARAQSSPLVFPGAFSRWL